MKTIMTITFALSAAMSFAAGFSVDLREDAMTNEKELLVYTVGDSVSDGLIKYDPALVISIHDPSVDDAGHVRFAAKDISIYVKIKTEGMKRGMDTMQYKVGTNAVVKAVMSTSEDRRAALIPRPSEFLNQLKDGGTVFFRFTTTLGAERTLKFPDIPSGAVKTAVDAWLKKNSHRLKKFSKKFEIPY